MLAFPPPTVDDEVVAERLDRTGYSGLRSILLRLADVTERAGRVFNELNAETNAFHERTDAISVKYQQLQHYFIQSPACAIFDDTSHAATHIDQDVKDQDIALNEAWTRPASAGLTSVQRNATPSPTPSAGRAAGIEKVSPHSTHLADYYRKGLATGSDAAQPAPAAISVEAAAQDAETNASNSVQKQSQAETNSIQRSMSFVGKSIQKSKATWVAKSGPLHDTQASSSKKHVTESDVPTGPLRRHIELANITNTNPRLSAASKVWSQGSGGDTPRRLHTLNIPFTQEQALRASFDPEYRQAVRQMSTVQQSATFGKHEFSSGHPNTVSLPFAPGHELDPGSPMSGYPDGETARERLKKTFGLATSVAHLRGHDLNSGSISALRESVVSQASQESAQSPGAQQEQRFIADGNMRMSRDDLQQAFMKLRPLSPSPLFPGPGLASPPLNQDPPFPPNMDQHNHPISTHAGHAIPSTHASQQHTQEIVDPTQQPNAHQSPAPPSRPWGQEPRPSSATPSHPQYPIPNTAPEAPALSPRQTPEQEDSQIFMSPRPNFNEANGASPSTRTEYFDPSQSPGPYQSPARYQFHPVAQNYNQRKTTSLHPEIPPGQSMSPRMQPTASPRHLGFPPGPSSQYGGSNRGAQAQQSSMQPPVSPLAHHDRHARGQSSSRPVSPLSSHAKPNGSVTGHSMHNMQQPGHGAQQPGYQSLQPGFNQQAGHPAQQPGYNSQRTGQNSQHAGYNAQHTGHSSQQPSRNAGFNQQPASHNSQQPAYSSQQPGYASQHTGYSMQKTGYNPQDPRQQGFAQDTRNMGPGHSGRPGPPAQPPSMQWSRSGQQDSRHYSQSGTPSSHMHGRSPVPSSSHHNQLPPGMSPHSMMHSGRYPGPPTQQISQSGAPMYPGQLAHPGQQMGPGPHYAGQHSISWKQGPSQEALQGSGPLRRSRPVNSMNQAMPQPGQRGPPGSHPYPLQQYATGVHSAYTPGITPQYPGAPMPGQPPYPGSSARPQGSPHWQQPQPPTPPTATTQAGNSPFASASWTHPPHDLDSSRRPPQQGMQYTAAGGYPPSNQSSNPGVPPGSGPGLEHSQRSVAPGQQSSLSPGGLQQPLSPQPSTVVSAPFASTRDMPVTSMGVPTQPTAANLASMQSQQQQALQRPQTAMSNASQHTTASVAAAAAASGKPAFYLAAKAVKSGQVSPRSTTSNGPPSNTPPGRAPSVRSNPGSDYLSPRNTPDQPHLSPRRQVMASIDSTSTAAYSNRHVPDPQAHGSYPRGPGSTHSSRPGSSQPSSPPNSQRNTPTIAAARNMANRVAGSAATSPAALASGTRGGGPAARASPMVNPRVKGPDAGVGAIIERARAVRRMESSADGWGDLGASQDTIGSGN